MDRQLPEAKLCQAAGARLKADGWRVVSEVPFWERNVDLAASRGCELLVLEAKTSFTQRLQSQISRAAWAADLAIAVVGTTPRGGKLEWAAKCQIGVWQVAESGEIIVLVEPGKRKAPEGFFRKRLLERMSRMPESVDGGRPCLDG